MDSALLNVERKLYHLITVENEKDREVFEGFVWLAKRWLKDDSLLFQNSSRFNLIQETTLGKKFPPDPSVDSVCTDVWEKKPECHEASLNK